MSGSAGIRHVTAICSDAKRNVAFYAGALGLRMVKQTVNFDDPTTWHFETGRPCGLQRKPICRRDQVLRPTDQNRPLLLPSAARSSCRPGTRYDAPRSSPPCRRSRESIDLRARRQNSSVACAREHPFVLCPARLTQ